MIYLDNAATSFPKPEAVYKRVEDVLRRISGSPGRASHRMAAEASRVVFDARETVAKVINAKDASRVAFTKNATEAVNIALKGLLKPGDHLITTSFEHNSVAKTAGWVEQCGVEVTRVRPDSSGFVDPSEVARAIKKNTRLASIVHASNVFGSVQPVEEIGRLCRDKGVIFMADGAQTVGAMPVDVEAMNIDILAATGHKALFGPQGTGFIYVRDGIEPVPLISGGTGELDTVLEMPERLESGTMNTPGIGGLGAGAAFVLSEGVEKIRAFEEGLVEALLRGLGSVKGVRIIGTTDARRRASLVAFNIDGVKPYDAGQKIDNDFGILVRTGAHCAPDAHREAGTHPEGAVRVSPGYFNTEADIEEFVRAVATIAKRG